MSQLSCPHCGGKLSANPIGHWWAKFKCGHCKKPLQFDRKTNLLGTVGSVCFLLAAYAFVAGIGGAYSSHIAAVAGALWIALTGLSYSLRGIDKAPTPPAS